MRPPVLFILLLTWCLLPTRGHAQSSAELIARLDAAETPLERYELQYRLAELLSEGDEPEQAARFGEQALKSAERADAPRLRALAARRLAGIYRRLGNFRRASAVSLEALDYYTDPDNGTPQTPVLPFDRLQFDRALRESEARTAEAEARLREKEEAIRQLSLETFEQQDLARRARQELSDRTIENQRAELATMEAHLQRNYAIMVGLAVSALALFFFYRFRNKARSSRRLAAARKRSDELLENILPVDIARELKDTGEARARRFSEVTVMFCDFVNFTRTAAELGPEALVKELDACFRGFDDIIDDYPEVEKIKTIGDAYMVASGLHQGESSPGDILRAAIRMQSFLEGEAAKRKALGLPFFTARIGLHTGPVVAGVVGSRKFAYDIWGDTVNVASRMESASEAGKINVSETTWERIHEDFACEYRGEIEAKNKGRVGMYFVNGERIKP